MDIDAHAGTSPEEVGPNELPDAQQGETEDSLLSVLRSAVEERPDGDEISTAGTPTAQDREQSDAPEQKPGVEGEPESELSQEQIDMMPRKLGKRFKELVTDRGQWRAKATEYEADAKQYRDIQSFMQTNGLTPEEVAESLGILAQAKTGDPAKAYELMLQRTQALAVMAGKQLPTDLEEKVEQGYIDRETAQDLHQQRVSAERKAQLATSQLERRSVQDQRSQVNEMASAVSAWEHATKSSDPDFDLKAELVKDRVRAHVASYGMPKNAEQALKVSKDAYEAVTQTLLRVRGDKAPMRTAVGGKTNGSAAPEPKNLLDVIRRVSAGG
jgi:hypothetical protein